MPWWGPHPVPLILSVAKFSKVIFFNHNGFIVLSLSILISPLPHFPSVAAGNVGILLKWELNREYISLVQGEWNVLMSFAVISKCDYC